jgi:hypothetical protein
MTVSQRKMPMQRAKADNPASTATVLAHAPCSPLKRRAANTTIVGAIKIE